MAESNGLLPRYPNESAYRISLRAGKFLRAQRWRTIICLAGMTCSPRSRLAIRPFPILPREGFIAETENGRIYASVDFAQIELAHASKGARASSLSDHRAN